MKFTQAVFCGLAALLIQPAQAAAPNLQTPAPVIYLADNLDEVDQLGWCIDTLGRGLSDQLQVHSCKPRGGDVQFSFDTATGQLKSVAFEGLCAAYTGTVPLALTACDGTPSQAFAYDPNGMTLQLASDPEKCLVAGAESRTAGPFMSRDLLVSDCDATEAPLKQWIIKP